MTDQPKPRATIEANIHAGTISGQVAVGEHVEQHQTVQSGLAALSQAEQQDLQALIDELKQKIAAEAPPEKKEPALERADEIEQELKAKKPDVTTLEYVRNWFVKNIPQLAGTVTGLIVNPIVGKLVEAAGEAVAAEFKRRFGLEEGKG